MAEFRQWCPGISPEGGINGRRSSSEGISGKVCLTLPWAGREVLSPCVHSLGVSQTSQILKLPLKGGRQSSLWHCVGFSGSSESCDLSLQKHFRSSGFWRVENCPLRVCLYILPFITSNSSPGVFPELYIVYRAAYWELPLGYPTATTMLTGPKTCFSSGLPSYSAWHDHIQTRNLEVTHNFFFYLTLPQKSATSSYFYTFFTLLPISTIFLSILHVLNTDLFGRQVWSYASGWEQP